MANRVQIKFICVHPDSARLDTKTRFIQALFCCVLTGTLLFVFSKPAWAAEERYLANSVGLEHIAGGMFAFAIIVALYYLFQPKMQQRRTARKNETDPQ